MPSILVIPARRDATTTSSVPQLQLNRTSPICGPQDIFFTMRAALHMRALRPGSRLTRLRPSQPHSVPPTRQASSLVTDARSATTRTKNLVYGTALTLALSFGYLYLTDTRSSIHEWLVVPALRHIYPDGEDAHHAGTKIIKALYSFGIHPRERGNLDAAGDLEVNIFGHRLSNPIGTSAGMDKGADMPTPVFHMGAALVEVGAVTPLPQEGNPKPRVFRLPSQNALINRYGFNSEGAETVAMRLRHRVRQFAYHAGLGIDEEAERKVLDGEAGVPPGSLIPGRLLAVQIAKNKTTSEQDIEAVKRDYTSCVDTLAKYADIIVVNVSSPNTPGLRALQNVEPLTQLLNSVVQAAKKVDRKSKPAIMVKVSPDEDSDEQVSGICEAVWDSGVDGVIVGNTTKKRPDPLPKGYLLPQAEAGILLEQGGYSGPQMFERTLSLVKKYRQALDDGPKQLPPSSSKSGPSSVVHATGDEHETSMATPSLTNVDDLASSAPTVTLQPTSEQHRDTAPAPVAPTKVIFATGGITNGRQAREILDAGASVAQVYTAIIYGGVGTISRIKEEMREEATRKR